MKKVVNSVLASALALTVAPMVVGAEEAATTTAPQIDPALDKVVKRLSALGLVEGMGNGDFAIDKNVTRAQFATLVVRARGLASGVPLAQNEARFADVKSADWFAGWVNVAAGQELVKGYPNNSFGPANNVTYAEAVAMIVRALGYDVAVKGVWPNNYIAKAAELGISKGVKIDPNKPATRGDIFLMLDNSLNIDLMKQNEYGAGDLSYTIEKDKTLLSEYLDVDVYDMDWANSKDHDTEDLPFVSNIPVTGLGTIKGNEVSFDKHSGTPISGTYKVAEGINPNDFGGQHVQVWVKDDREDTIVWMESSEDEEVIFDKLDTLYFQDKVLKSAKYDGKLSDYEIKLSNGKTYQFADEDDFKITYNYKRYGKNWAEAFEDIGMDWDNIDAYQTKVVLDDNGDIVYMSVVDDITADKDTDAKFGSEVVKKVDLDKQKVYTLDGKDLDLKGDEEGKDFIVFRNGQPAKLADLKEMDVYSVYYADGDKDHKIIVANSTVVEGKVDDVEYRYTNNRNNNFLKIGDKKYRIRAASFSDDKNKTIETWTNEDADKFLDLDGLNVKLYLDTTGRVRHIETTTALKERTITAVLTKDVFYDELKDEYSLTVYNEKNAKKTLNVTDDEDFKGVDGHDEIMKAFKVVQDKPVIVRYELGADEKVKEVKLVTDELLHVDKDDWNKAADEDDNVVKIDGQTYEVADDAVVFDLTGDVEKTGARNEWKDVGTAKFKNIADDDYEVYVHEKNGEVDYMYVVEGDKSIASEGEYGIVMTFNYNNDDDYIQILTKDGSIQRYKLDGTVDDEFGRYDTIRYELNSEKELIVEDSYVVVEGSDLADDRPDLVRFNEDYDTDDIDSIAAVRVDEIDGNKVTYKDEAGKKHYYYVTSNTAYFNAYDLEKKSDLDEGDYALLIDTDDDGSAVDYVVYVADQDFVDDFSLDMDSFLAQTPDDGGEVDPDVTITASGTEKVVIANLSRYTITGQVETDADAEVTVTVGSKTVDAELDADGKFSVKIDATSGAKEFTVTATVEGEETSKTFKF